MTQSQPETELVGDDAAVEFLNKMASPEEDEEAAEEGEMDESDAEEDEHEVSDPVEEPDPLAWLKNKHKISVQGEEIEVTADEAFKGYMRDADYRQKTERAAQLTREAEQERQRVSAEREHYANHLEVLAQALHTELVGDESRLSEMLETDPIGYLRMKEHVAQKRQLIEQAVYQRQLLQQQSEADRQREYQAYVSEQRKALFDAVPEWRDPKQREAESNAIGEYLLQMGYAADELSMLTDHRAMRVVRDAMRFSKQQQIKKQQTAQAKKPVVAGTRNAPTQSKPDAEKLKARAQRTHSTDDIVAFLNSRD